MNEYIADLDDSLQDVGEDADLRRMISGSPVDVNCRIRVRSYRQQNDPFTPGGSELSQFVYDVIMSPTQIIKAGWPGSVGGINPSYPKRGDYLVIQGRQRAIEDVDNIMVGGE